MQVPRTAACAAAVGLLAILPATAAAKPVAALGHYAQRNLVSDQAGKAELMDPNLVNPWGLAFGPASGPTPAWTANNGNDNATLYTGGLAPNDVKMVPLIVDIPGGAPTGQVFNGSSGFMVDGAPARFIFSSEAGRITAWSQSSGTSAKTMARVRGAVFKGLAIAGNRIYATDFHNNRVDVWNANFKRVGRRHAFRDRRLPRRFAPFGIEAVGNHIWVTFAKQDAKGEDEIDKAHLGFVDVFDKRGRLLRRFARRGPLNAPWAVVKAPSGFGAASGDVLIGNFGDGRINVYKPNGRLLGQLADASGAKLTIDGLWALEFGNGVIGTTKSLLFTAGPDDESHGLFGELNAM
ncbi:MAG TPA: TIGR03118 family protein [Solirubrobacteraceae bacterium]|jgi:uncharacterized protein (TIGR03118 family)